jgi:hypothetical protein
LGEPVEVLLPLKFANFDKMRGGDVIIAVANQPQEKFAARAVRRRTILYRAYR